MSPSSITLEQVADTLSVHLPLYRLRKPAYQTVMLQALQRIWDADHRRVLDVGGGTGVIAQAVQDLFPVEKVLSIDVEDRYAAGLTIETSVYDGEELPFGDGAFDAVMFNNVIHHIPRSRRAALLRECRRVAPHGAAYIKDHLAASALDHGRLAALDWIGNVPFGGMVTAHYLGKDDWDLLAAESGYQIEAREWGDYRAPPLSALFPNRLEVTMRWRPLPTG